MTQWSALTYAITDSYRGETFRDLIAEPVLQGAAITLQTHGALESAFKIGVEAAKTTLLIGFNIPDKSRGALEDAGIRYLEFRISPVQFSRDLCFHYRTNCDEIDNILEGYCIPNDAIKLQASHLRASIRAHRRKLEKQNTHFSDLSNTTVIIGDDPNYPAPDIDIKSLPPLKRFAGVLQKLDKERRILYKPAAEEDSEEMLTWLSQLLDVQVKLCHQSTYQLLCFDEDIRLIGANATILQEAEWFSKEVMQLSPPLTDMKRTLNGYNHIPFTALLAPAFWRSIAYQKAESIPTLDQMPSHLCAREMFDLWGDYEKIMTWCRTHPYQSFIRSGGGALNDRISALERQSHFNAISAKGPSTTDANTSNSALADLKNTCAGKTAYVLGNAHSLNELNLERLIKEDAFWCNRAFELEKRGIPFLPKYYMYADVLGFKNFGEKVMAVKAEKKFFRHDVYNYAKTEWSLDLQKQHVLPFISIADPGMHEGFFSLDPTSHTYCGRTVVLDAIQIAAYMGYSKILVGGVDLDYSQPYFFGVSINGRMPEDEAIRAFEIARDRLAQRGIVLQKITQSPRLPLQYTESEFQKR